MDKKYFGTDGVRGKANQGNLRPSVILRISQALAHVLKTKDSSGALNVGVCGDSRISQDMIRASLAAGLTSMGGNVRDFGVLPTPALALLTRIRKLSMGVMISASHNPMGDNGIKVFDQSGFKLADETELKVEELLENNWKPDLALDGGLGRMVRDESGFEDYLSHLMGFCQGLSFNRMKIAVDCANGAASKVAPEVLNRLGAKVAVMANDPDGININENCGSVYPQRLQELVVSEGCDLGVALDGDADRSLFVDAKGVLINGDHVMAFLAPWMKDKGELNCNTVVATVMSNMGLEAALKGHGIVLERTPVGDRHVTMRLRQGDFSLGGEQSGHFIFGKENNYTGDGLFSALKVLRCLVETGKSLEELNAMMEDFPQVLINVRVSRTPALDKTPLIAKAVKEAEAELKDQGRVLYRYSGTEPLARVMVEGREENKVKALAQSISEAVKKEIG